MLRAKLDGCDGADVVMPYCVGQVQQQFILAFDHHAAHPRLLPENSQAPLEDRPRGTITGVERIEHLASGVREPLLIVTLAEMPAELIHPAHLLRQHERVHRIRGRIKEVSGIVPHLMGVDQQMRLPGQIGGDTPAAFPLALQEPIAIHVKQIVVESPSRPPLLMLNGQRLSVRKHATRFAKHVDEPLMPIGVLQRVDDHHHVGQHVSRGCAAIRQKMIRRQHRRFRTRCLVAMHAEGEPDDGRQA